MLGKITEQTYMPEEIRDDDFTGTEVPADAEINPADNLAQDAVDECQDGATMEGATFARPRETIEAPTPPPEQATAPVSMTPTSFNSFGKREVPAKVEAAPDANVEVAAVPAPVRQQAAAPYIAGAALYGEAESQDRATAVEAQPAGYPIEASDVTGGDDGVPKAPDAATETPDEPAPPKAPGDGGSKTPPPEGFPAPGAEDDEGPEQPDNKKDAEGKQGEQTPEEPSEPEPTPPEQLRIIIRDRPRRPEEVALGTDEEVWPSYRTVSRYAYVLDEDVPPIDIAAAEDWLETLKEDGLPQPIAHTFDEHLESIQDCVEALGNDVGLELSTRRRPTADFVRIYSLENFKRVREVRSLKPEDAAFCTIEGGVYVEEQATPEETLMSAGHEFVHRDSYRLIRLYTVRNAEGQKELRVSTARIGLRTKDKYHMLNEVTTETTNIELVRRRWPHREALSDMQFPRDKVSYSRSMILFDEVMRVAGEPRQILRGLQLDMLGGSTTGTDMFSQAVGNRVMRELTYLKPNTPGGALKAARAIGLHSAAQQKIRNRDTNGIFDWL
jgi:hypothetical protein